MFAHEVADLMRKQNPDMSTVQISKLTGEKWHALSDGEKKKYQDLAAMDKQRFEKELAEETRQNGGRPLP